jgi:hypothetical protein
MASDRSARGKTELGDNIRVLDGQCLLEALPWTNSVGSEELAGSGPQATVLYFPSSSSKTCASELPLLAQGLCFPVAFRDSRMTSPAM